MRKFDQYKQVATSQYETYENCVVIAVSKSFLKFFGRHSEKNLNVVKVVPRTYPLCDTCPDELAEDEAIIAVNEQFRYLAQKHNDGFILFRDVTVTKHNVKGQKVTFDGHQRENKEYSPNKTTLTLSYGDFNLTKVEPQDFSVDIAGLHDLVQINDKHVPSEAIAQIQLDDTQVEMVQMLGKAING